jgi:hypothetical protein
MAHNERKAPTEAAVMIGRASIGQATGAIFQSHVRIVMFQPARSAADIAAVNLAAVVEAWSKLKTALFNPYRPELHYMRGPGPKWREKQARDRRTAQ